METEHQCQVCKKYLKSDQSLVDHLKDKHGFQDATEEEKTPDWSGECENCGASPIVPITGMCGPCTFGEADTINGNW